MSPQKVTLILSLLLSHVLGATTCTTSVNIGYDVQETSRQASNAAKANWEWGTQAEALLELQNSGISVFSDSAFPSGKVPKVQTAATDYAKSKIKTSGNTLTAAGVSAGDPASLIVPAVLLGQSDPIYLQAAERQINELLTRVPRYSNGAISHRYDGKALWSDFIYMVPPSLAYYGVATNNISLVQEAVRQVSLYRNILQDQKTGLWKHIAGGKGDAGTWSTGNGWAAAGITRVLATLTNLGPGRNLTSERQSLVQYAAEIIDGAIKNTGDASNGLLHNYITDASTFPEAAGTAALAAAVYRLAVLEHTTFAQPRYLDWADARRIAVGKSVKSSGQVSPVVNPNKYTQNTPYSGVSPEAQSFTVLLYAAYRDCICAGYCK